MKFLGFNITTKKELKSEISLLVQEKNDLWEERHDLINEVSAYKHNFPLSIGQIVYDLQLRDAKGRYTKTNPSRTHSKINKIVVNEDNYFELVRRMKLKDVFVNEDTAISYLSVLCKD